MFKKIGKKVPDHHLLFFSLVLIVLFFILLFNPFYSPETKVEVIALENNVSIALSKTLTDYGFSGTFVQIKQDENYLYVISQNVLSTHQTLLKIQKSNLELDPLNPPVDISNGNTHAFYHMIIADDGIYLAGTDTSVTALTNGSWQMQKRSLNDLSIIWNEDYRDGIISRGGAYNIVKDGLYVYILGWYSDNPCFSGCTQIEKENRTIMIQRRNAFNGSDASILDENWSSSIKEAREYHHEIWDDSEFIYANVSGYDLKIKKSDLSLNKSVATRVEGSSNGFSYGNYLYTLSYNTSCSSPYYSCLYKINKSDLSEEVGPVDPITLSTVPDWINAFSIKEENGQIYYSEYLFDAWDPIEPKESKIHEIDLNLNTINTINFNTGDNGIHAVKFILDGPFIYTIDFAHPISHIAKIDNPFYIAPTVCNSCADCEAKILSASSGDTIILTQDINNFNGDCITINNTTSYPSRIFDCAGHLIDGVAQNNTGIWIAPANLDIVNCRISDFNIGISKAIGGNSVFDNISVFNNSTGISVYGQKTEILNSTVANNNIGVSASFMYISINNLLVDNVSFDNNATALYFDEGKEAVPQHSSFINNTIDIDLSGTGNLNRWATANYSATFKG